MSGSGFSAQRAAVVNLGQQTLALLRRPGEVQVGREVAIGLQESLHRLESGRFQVAFVGQMKAGKSTLVNAMVLGRQIMPVASTPQTAKLARILYSDAPSATVRFYSREEWHELAALAAQEDQPAQSADPDEAFSYAQQLREAREQVGDQLDDLLGTTRDIALEDLKDYVAAYDPSIPQGRYVSVTHAVDVRYPHPWPPQVDFVDTPGINDPNVLRERVTMDYLRQADAVILVLYAGRPGGRADIEFLKRTLLPIGFNRILIALNKFDMVPEHEGGDVGTYLRDLLQTTVIDAAKAQNVELPPDFERILDLEHIYPVSGIRALLGRAEGDIPEGKFYFKQTCKKKGIESYQEAIEKSGVLELEAGLLDFLMTQKGRELLLAPLRKADGAARELIRRAEQERERASEQLRDMRKTEDELQRDLRDQQKRLQDVEGAIAEINGLLRLWTRQQLERAQSDAIRRVRAFVDDVQHSFLRRIDQIGALDAASHHGHIIELNTDLAWRARTLRDELEQVMTDGFLRLRRRLQGDLQDEIRQRIPDYHASPWILEEIDALGRMDFTVDLPPLVALEINEATLRQSVRQLLKAGEFRARLKEDLRQLVLDFEARCMTYVRTTPDLVEARILEQVGGVVQHVRAHVQHRIDDLQRALRDRTAAVEEAAARQETLNARLDALADTLQSARALTAQAEEVLRRLDAPEP